MAESEAEKLVKTYADAAAATLQADMKNFNTTKAACEGKGGEVATDGRFDFSAHAQIPLAEGTHYKTLERVRDEWQQKGYEIQSFRTLPDGDRAEVAARNPSDGVQISLTSTKPPAAVALLVLTPCYMPPSP